MMKLLSVLTNEDTPKSPQVLEVTSSRKRMTSVRLDEELESKIQKLMQLSAELFGMDISKTDIIKSALAIGIPELEAKIKRFKQAI